MGIPSKLLVLIGVLVLVLAAACQPSIPLVGTELNGRVSPPFRLLDQFGRPVALEDFRGKPVAILFLYTQCPDICPMSAAKVRTALDGLGDDANRVAVLAVSTDPDGDDIHAAREFSIRHDLADRWHFLIGNRATLQAIWSAYYIHVAPSATTPLIDHGGYIYILDKEGRQRALLNQDFTPDDLAQNFRSLLAE